MDVGTGSFEYDADSESSQRSAMTHTLNAAPHQSSYMQDETSASEITDTGAEESGTTSEYSSSTQFGIYNQNDTTDDEANDKSTLAGTISRDSGYFTAFSELYSHTEDTKDQTAEGSEIESTGHRHSARSDFSDGNPWIDMGSVSSGTNGSTVTDFLEGYLDILDDNNEEFYAFSHSRTWALIHNQIPMVNNASRDQSSGVILPSHEVTPALVPTCSQAECDFIASFLIPTMSEEDVYTSRDTQGHSAWSQPVGLPYVKPLQALDIDFLSNPRQGAPELIPTRPGTPIGSGKDKGDPTLMISDSSTHRVPIALTLRPADAFSYSLFGTSPPSSQTSAQ